ncbi:MAG: hypothetical protein HYY93_14570 [Planctomycetes bacterium]|nr:hypothetical protein [Planctomycetota bacterium]
MEPITRKRLPALELFRTAGLSLLCLSFLSSGCSTPPRICEYAFDGRGFLPHENVRKWVENQIATTLNGTSSIPDKE